MSHMSMGFLSSPELLVQRPTNQLVNRKTDVFSIFLSIFVDTDLREKYLNLDLSPSDMERIQVQLGGKVAFAFISSHQSWHKEDLLKLVSLYKKHDKRSHCFFLGELLLAHLDELNASERLELHNTLSELGVTHHIEASSVKSLLQDFFDQALDPETILSFTLAGMIYRGVKLKSLEKMALQSPRLFAGQIFINRGPVALARARTLAFGAEVLSFSVMGLQREYRQTQTMSWQRVFDTVSLNAILLGSLKGSFALGSRVSQWGMGVQVSQLSQQIFSQSSAVTGLILGHFAAGELALMQRMSWGDNLRQSIVTQGQLSLGSHLAKVTLGREHATRMDELERRSRQDDMFLRGGNGLFFGSRLTFATLGSPLQRIRHVHFREALHGESGDEPGQEWNPVLRKYWDEFVEKQKFHENNFRFVTETQSGDVWQSRFGTLTPEETLAALNKNLPQDSEYLILRVRGPRKKGFNEANHASVKIIGLSVKHYVKFLAEKPQLQELRFIFSNGYVCYVYRTHQNEIEWEIDHKDNLPELHSAEDIKRKKIYSLDIDYQGSNYEVDRTPKHLRVLLKKHRSRAGLSHAEVASRLKNDYGLNYNPKTLATYEYDIETGMAFELLFALAEIYHADLNKLIDAYNFTAWKQNRYEGIQDLSRDDWLSEYYPLFIEGERDVVKLLLYKNRQLRQTLGWKVFVKKKFPWAYYDTGRLADDALLGSRVIYSAEVNEGGALARDTLLGLNASLNIPLFELIDANNRTYFPDLVKALDFAFPGLAVYLDPQNQPHRVVANWQSRLGTVQHFLFALRRADADLAEKKSIVHIYRSEEGEEYSIRWGERENGSVDFNLYNRWIWKAFFKDLGLPLRLLDHYYREVGLDPDSPAVLLIDAIGAQRHTRFYQKTGVSASPVSDILNFRRRPLFDTVAQLGLALDQSKRALFIIGLYPELREIFPDLSASGPNAIKIEEGVLEEAFTHFHLGEFLFEYRLENGLNSEAVGEKIGMSMTNVNRLIRHPVKVTEVDRLAQIAELLSEHRHMPLLKAKQIVFLHFYPELLALFPVQKPGQRARLIAYDQLVAEREKRVDFSNLRSEVTAAMHRRGLKSRSDLAKHLNVDEDYAKKFMQSKQMLNAEDIRFICDHFPELDYSKWYLYFHRPALAYYLGRKSNGEINLDGLETFPRPQEAVTWMADLLVERILSKYGTFHKAHKETNIGDLEREIRLRQSVADRVWRPEMIEKMTEVLDLSSEERRLVFYYMSQLEMDSIVHP